MASAKEVKGLIHNVLTSTTQKITVQKLDCEYRALVGEKIPYVKLGFQNLELYLRSLPDILQVYGRGEFAEVQVVVSAKSAHVRELISKQRKPGVGRANRSRSNRSNNAARRSNSTPQVTPVLNQRNQNVYNVGGMLKQEQSSQLYSTTPCSFLPASQAVRNNTNPNGFANKWTYTNKHRQPLNDSCNSTPTNSMSNTNNKNKYTNTTKVLPKPDTPKPKPLLRKDAIFLSDDQLNIKVPLTIQNNLQTLISNHPDGIWCTKIPDAYKQKFGTDFDFVEYGYTSLQQMCMDLGSTFNCVQPGYGDYKVFSKNHPVPKDLLNKVQQTNGRLLTEMMEAMESPFPENSVADLLMNFNNYNVPVDVIPCDECLEKQWIDPTDQIGDYLDVTIGEIYDPSKFWINLSNHRSQLNTMMDDMQKFYGTNSKIYGVPTFALKRNLHVAAVFLNEYNRAVIMNAMCNSQGLIKVFFIDYGTVSLIKPSEVCYLHKQFGELPTQGIRARLAGIRPAGANVDWTWAASKEFLKLVENKDLIAQIMNFDVDKRILDVIVIDKVDVIVNDALVYTKHACKVHLDVVNNNSPLDTSSTSSDAKIESSLKPKVILDILRKYRK